MAVCCSTPLFTLFLLTSTLLHLNITCALGGTSGWWMCCGSSYTCSLPQFLLGAGWIHPANRGKMLEKSLSSFHQQTVDTSMWPLHVTKTTQGSAISSIILHYTLCPTSPDNNQHCDIRKTQDTEQDRWPVAVLWKPAGCSQHQPPETVWSVA